MRVKRKGFRTTGAILMIHEARFRKPTAVRAWTWASECSRCPKKESISGTAFGRAGESGDRSADRHGWLLAGRACLPSGRNATGGRGSLRRLPRRPGRPARLNACGRVRRRAPNLACPADARSIDDLRVADVGRAREVWARRALPALAEQACACARGARLSHHARASGVNGRLGRGCTCAR